MEGAEANALFPNIYLNNFINKYHQAKRKRKESILLVIRSSVGLIRHVFHSTVASYMAPATADTILLSIVQLCYTITPISLSLSLSFALILYINSV